MAPTPAKKAPAKKVAAAPAKTAGKAAARKSAPTKAATKSASRQEAGRDARQRPQGSRGEGAGHARPPHEGCSGEGDEGAAAKSVAGAEELDGQEHRGQDGCSQPARARKEVAAKSSSHFNAAFLASQRELLIEERSNLLGQAQRLEDEAAELMEDLDPGDVQFDDESGEGDSLVVERERDLALSAQARQTVSDIDAALARIKNGTYGLSVVSGRPIPKERLKAIPWATELVEEKVGGLGSRR